MRGTWGTFPRRNKEVAQNWLSKHECYLFIKWGLLILQVGSDLLFLCSYPPTREARRGVYWNPAQQNFTHPYTEYPWVSDSLANKPPIIKDVRSKWCVWDQSHVTIVWNTRETGDIHWTKGCQKISFGRSGGCKFCVVPQVHFHQGTALHLALLFLINVTCIW